MISQTFFGSHKHKDADAPVEDDNEPQGHKLYTGASNKPQTNNLESDSLNVQSIDITVGNHDYPDYKPSKITMHVQYCIG